MLEGLVHDGVAAERTITVAVSHHGPVRSWLLLRFFRQCFTVEHMFLSKGSVAELTIPPAKKQNVPIARDAISFPVRSNTHDCFFFLSLFFPCRFRASGAFSGASTNRPPTFTPATLMPLLYRYLPTVLNQNLAMFGGSCVEPLSGGVMR